MKVLIVLCLASIASCGRRHPNGDEGNNRGNHEELIELCRRHGCLSDNTGNNILGNTVGGVLGNNGPLGGIVGNNGILGGITGNNGVLGGVTGNNGILGGVTGNNGILGGVTGNNGILGGVTGNNGLLGGIVGNNGPLGGLLGGSGGSGGLLGGLVNRLVHGLSELLESVLDDNPENVALIPDILNEVVEIARSLLRSRHEIDENLIIVIIRSNTKLTRCLDEAEIDIQVVLEMIIKSLCSLYNRINLQ